MSHEYPRRFGIVNGGCVVDIPQRRDVCLRQYTLDSPLPSPHVSGHKRKPHIFILIPCVSLAMASSLSAAKQQLRSLMKQKLTAVTQDSITTQSMTAITTIIVMPAFVASVT